MTFAWPLPWWIVAAWGIVALVVAVVAYARAVPPLSSTKRAGLVALRFAAFSVLLLFILRPVMVQPAPRSLDSRIAVLVDTSRSMGLTDGDRQTRLAAAQALLRDRLVPALRGRYQVELYSFDRAATRRPLDRLDASGPLTDLVGAVRSVRTASGPERAEAIVVLSDGGQTGEPDLSRVATPGAPVFTVPIGAARVERDREVTAASVGEARVEGSIVELSATIVSHGFGTSPFEVRLLENGRPLQVRRATPPADGAPMTQVFRLSPKREVPSVYTVEVPAEEGELTETNNRRSVLVRPASQPRRVLLVQGAPGFEHAFLRRAWAGDAGLELDSVVRKGRDGDGTATYYVQAESSRAEALRAGFPLSREALFAYDAIVLANMSASQLTDAQAVWTAAFVAERGGGLLVLGARTFAPGGLRGTPIDEALPVDFTGRVAADGDADARGREGRLIVTPAGERHPITQLAGSPAASRAQWTELPALPATAAMGQPRPGAQVLISADGPAGERPLVAVQQYGRGRTLVFGGEASWRWRMQLPSDNRTYETFWRQAGRWLAAGAPDPISVSVTPGPPGVATPITVQVFDKAFVPVATASVRVEVTGPDGELHELHATPANGASGRYRTTFTPASPGTYDVRVVARRGSASGQEGTREEPPSAANDPTVLRVSTAPRDQDAGDEGLREEGDAPLGEAHEWLLVGGVDPEMADPRRNDAALERLAEATGGRLLESNELARVPDLIAAQTSSASVWVQRELWHSPWSFLLVAGMLSAEWALRRRWGLR